MNWVANIVGIIGLALLIIAAIFIGVMSNNEEIIPLKQKVCVILCLILGAAGLAFGMYNFLASYEKAEAKYYASVANWLDTDYGIKASLKNTQLLVNGESFVTTYLSKTVTISTIENLAGDLVVVDQNKTVLEPLQ